MDQGARALSTRDRTGFPKAHSGPEEVAREANAPVAVLRKTRHGDRAVEIDLRGTEEGQLTPALVDDIISSAKTMAIARP